MVARLVELALLLATPGSVPRPPATGSRASRSGAGDGLAAVQTARGLLLHRVRLADGRVADYQIVAPTEWNFHPTARWCAASSGLEPRDEAALVRSAQLVVQALDPCVACRVEVGHA